MNLITKKGRCVGNRIAIDKNIETDAEKTCILKEEIAHFQTTVGDITDQTKISNIKQEKIARAIAIENLCNLEKIVDAYKKEKGWQYIISRKDENGKWKQYNLFRTIKNNKFYIVAYIAGTCGLRCGEILGLTLDDIDEVNMKIYVTKQWKKLKDGTIGFGDSKTGNTPRKVPITKTILNEIKDYVSSRPIPIHKRIGPFNEDSITKYLNADLRKVAGISLHELKHTYATLLIGNDIDFKTVANFLGYDVKQTISTYSHVTDDMIKKAGNKIAKIF